MSKIRSFELFHGAVLTKLVRSDRPITMRLIQTSPKEEWRLYLVNGNKGDINFYMRVGKNPRKLDKKKGISWYFLFQRIEWGKIKELLKKGRLYVFFICGAKKVNEDMHLCVVGPEKINDVLDFNFEGASQNVTVKKLKDKSYRVTGSKKNQEVIIYQKAIDDVFAEIG